MTNYPIKGTKHVRETIIFPRTFRDEFDHFEHDQTIARKIIWEGNWVSPTWKDYRLPLVGF